MKLRKVIKNGKKMWLADLGTWRGNRERYYRDTRKAAQQIIVKREDERRREGEMGFDIPLAQRLELRELKHACDELHISPARAAAFLRTHYVNLEAKSLSDATVECIAEKERAGKRPAYTRKLNSHLKSFATGREGMHCADVTRKDVEAWAWSGKNATVKAVSARSRIIDLGTFFSFCIKRKWCAVNPVANIEPIMLEDKPPGIHTVEQAKALLKACMDHPDGRAVICYVALGYFGGLRPSEALRLRPEDIQAHSINVEADKAKTRRRRLIPINNTLKAWLAISSIPRQKNFHRDFERVKAGVAWSHNVLRHSFCSYALPVFGALKTAEWAGHSEQILFAHYRARVRPDDAKAFWALRP